MKEKHLTIFTVSILVSISILPSLSTAAKNDSLIQVTTETCNLAGYGPKTVSLTTDQYNNLDQYCTNFHTKLTQATTLQQVTCLYKEAVVVLHSFNLLPSGMTLQKAQYLVEHLAQFSQRLSTIASTHFTETSNRYCLIAGYTTRTWFTSPFLGFLLALLFFFQNHDTIAFFLFAAMILSDLATQSVPLASFDIVSFGEAWTDGWEGEWHDAYSEGWVHTLGLKGAHNWNGTFKGTLPFEVIGGSSLYSEPYPGAMGFIGIKTRSINRPCFFLGFALNVQLEYVR